MPQLDISTYFTQFFWVIVTFLSFWFVMDRFIVTKIAENIDNRKLKYDDLIIKAKKVNQKAKASLKKYEEAITAAQKNAMEKIKQNEEELKITISTKQHEVEKRIDQTIKEKQEYLEKELNNTLSNLDSLAELTALKVLQRLDIKDITIDDIKELSKKEMKDE